VSFTSLTHTAGYEDTTIVEFHFSISSIYSIPFGTLRIILDEACKIEIGRGYN
jgi:hypothetical protein